MSNMFCKILATRVPTNGWAGERDLENRSKKHTHTTTTTSYEMGRVQSVYITPINEKD